MADNKTQIVITAEDKTAAAFATAKAGLERFSAAYATLGGLAGVGVAGALVAGIKSVIDLGDEMNDLSQKVGIGVKNLATWKLAADQSGTSLDAVAKGVKGLSKYMVENGDALKKAGITATDANGALIQLSDIFQAMPDGVEKTTLAVELFGKSGMDMIPMLGLGSKGLSEASEKAREYGERMALLAPLADKFNDQMAELALQSKVAGINLAVQVSPSLVKFAEQLNEGIRIAGGSTSALWEFGLLLPPGDVPKQLDETREALRRLHSEMTAGKEQNLSDGGSIDLSGVESRIGIMERRKKYLEFLQRQDVMAGAAKLGDNRDARDLRRDNASTMGVAEAMAKAQGLIKKGVGGGQTQGLTDVFGSGSYFTSDKATAESIRDSFKFENWAWGEIAKDRDDATKAVEKYDEGLRKSVQSLYDATDVGRFDSMLDGIGKAEEAFARGWISQDKLDAITASLMTVKGTGEEVFADLTRVIDSWGNKAADTFADLVVDSKASFGDLVNSMLKDIVRLQAKQVLDPITKGASDWLGGLFKNADGGAYASPDLGRYSGSVVSSPTLFRFANGGSIGLMGEAGAEAILPLQRGPNGKLGVQASGGGSIVINQSISVDSRSDQASIMQAMVAAKNAAIAEIHNSMRRGGSFA